MSYINTYNYDKISKRNLDKFLVRRVYNRFLNNALKDLDKESIVMIESPSDNYLDANISSIKTMIDNGFEGVYLSFQRPFKNIFSLFEREGINLDKIYVVDFATAFCKSDQELNPRCVNINSGFEFEEMIKIICLTLERLTQEKRFVFVDSISTYALHENLDDISRFPESLINAIKNRKIDDVTLIFNIANDIAKKRYVENINLYANEHIHLGLCT
ncbi:MAG: hypothetical protein JSV67_02230 [Thermoplasmatales archaeon]|jgi:hypothetical protein|nr:MAG: hypothetical protein JSV67_02230 [Thermoplasmatales archaeon]